jgi:hypothetical protein
MDQSLPSGLQNHLLWCDELGYGWHSAPPMEYSGEYFAHYQKLDNTPMGAALTKARLQLVGKFTDASLGVDIGIGGGRYVEESCGRGYDVSGEAVEWLKRLYYYADPYAVPVHSITCWDSLEHIPEPEKLLAQVTDWFFVSLPTFDDARQALKSKHFKPTEHLWYFSIPGLIRWAEAQGFQVMEVNHAETELGREGITSFAFKRVA